MQDIPANQTGSFLKKPRCLFFLSIASLLSMTSTIFPTTAQMYIFSMHAHIGKKWRLLLLRYTTNPNVNDIFLNIVSKYIYILCWRGVNWSDCIIFSDLLKQELIILQQFLTVTIARVVLRNHGKVLYRFYQIIHVQECRQKMKGFLPRYFQH